MINGNRNGNGKTLLFKAGQRYELVSRTCLVERAKSVPNNSGGHDEILLNGQELILELKGEDGRAHTFFDARHMREGISVTAIGSNEPLKPDHALQQLVEHFEMPKVPDVSEAKKEQFESNLMLVDKIQSFINQNVDAQFKLKRLQREDLARAGTTDGCVFAWDTGSGKSVAAILYALLRVGTDWTRSVKERGLYPLKPVLIIAPENLHDQLCAEWEKRFGIKKVTRLESQENYLKLTNGGMNHLPAGYLIASYTQMGLNRVKDIPNPNDTYEEAVGNDTQFTEAAALMKFFGVELVDAKAYKPTDEDLPCPPGMSPLIHQAIMVCRYRYKYFKKGVGEWLSEHKKAEALRLSTPCVPVKHDMKCVYSPSLADLCGHEFACVVIDEGTRIKGTDTIIGRAVRELDPPNRLVMTATPVKNRLKDIFWLLWWAAGGKDEAHPRFPYTSDPEEQERFAGEFNVCERNLTQEDKKRKGPRRKNGKKPRGKPGVEVCNIHRLWKFVAPNILRRRKEDFGEEIVKKLKHVIRAPMGKRQYEVYRYHLLGRYLDSTGKPATMAQLTRLRQAAAAPTNPDLVKLPTVQEGVPNGLFCSDKDYTPKLAAALDIVEQRMRAGEQTVIFSAFHEPMDTLSRRLTEATIPHDVLDGRKSGAWRGKMSAEFGRGLPRAKPVLIGGMKAMAEGNNWPKASNVIILAYDWAWDLYEQAINRVHRMNSIRDVNVWPIITEGTIERKLEAMTDEKGDSSDLVIDGKLIGESTEEINLAELLQIAFEEFNDGKIRTYDETLLEAEWPQLKSKLSEAWAVCKCREYT
jgi:hypothetical protein